MRIKQIAPIIGLFLFYLAVAATAGVPAKYKKMKISNLSGKKKDPVFSHEKHTTEYVNSKGKKAVCKDCHHTLAVSEPKDPKSVKPCTACHVLPGKPKVKHGGELASYLATKTASGNWENKTVLYHRQCRECHKLVAKANPAKKKIAGCKACH